MTTHRSTCRQGGGGGASGFLPISPPRLGDGGGAVVPAALLHAPAPLGLALAVDENLGGAQLLQELLLDVLGFDPSLLLLPARRCVSACDRRAAAALAEEASDSYLELDGNGFFRPWSRYEPS